MENDSVLVEMRECFIPFVINEYIQYDVVCNSGHLDYMGVYSYSTKQTAETFLQGHPYCQKCGAEQFIKETESKVFEDCRVDYDKALKFARKYFPEMFYKGDGKNLKEIWE